MKLCYSQILLIVCYLVSFSHPQTTTTPTETTTTQTETTTTPTGTATTSTETTTTSTGTTIKPTETTTTSTVTTSTSTTTITTTPGCISSLGCYSDSNNRLLSYMAYTNSGNSITNCIETCIQAGYLYAGVEAFTYCFCGNCLNLQYNSKVANDATCYQYTCPGDNTQYCGGMWLITVYQLNCTNDVINCSSTTTSTTTTTTPTGTATTSTEITTKPTVTTSTPTTTITTTPGCISSLGCYSDSNNRLFSYWPYYNNGNSITNCIKTCIQAGYLYAGVEAGTSCFCGNCLNLQYNSKVANDATCDQYTCPADNTQYCGGGWLITVYQLNCTNDVISCSSTTTSTTTTTTTTTNPYTPVTIGACETCEGGWSFLQTTSSCYKYVSTPVNWTTAEYVCEMVGTNLASIHSQAENNFVATLSGNVQIWIGLSHLSGMGTSPNCTLSWTDDSSVDFLYWITGQPDNFRGTSCADPNGEQCVQIWTSNGQWNDLNCLNVMGFVCKYSVPVCTTPAPTTTPCCNQWSSWSVTSACSDTCGACGTWTKTRSCLTASTCSCPGPSTKTEPCNLAPCAYPRNSCCNNYKASVIHNQIVCSNGQTEVSTTSIPETTCPSITTTVSGVCCPTDGMWSEWSASGSCSDTCGGFGYGTYIRTCLTGSNCPCEGSSIKTDRCNFAPCAYPRNSCDTGYKVQSINNGILCSSTTSSANQVTQASCCPSYGLWSTWGSWNSCTDTCGSCGTITRTRTCGSSPYGCPCSGSSSEIQYCNLAPCQYPRASCCNGYKAKVVGSSVVCSS